MQQKARVAQIDHPGFNKRTLTEHRQYICHCKFTSIERFFLARIFQPADGYVPVPEKIFPRSDPSYCHPSEQIRNPAITLFAHMIR